MATYAIGDIHGCLDNLKELLELINLNDSDEIWFTGDLVNVGKQSLETLIFIKNLKNKCHIVLGNHDLTLLAINNGSLNSKDIPNAFDSILKHQDKDEILEWLRLKPLVHYDKRFNALMVHAGVPPIWDLKLILELANEAENVIHGDGADKFFSNMYGNSPVIWSEELKGWDRVRYIVNCLTRIRFCTPYGELDFKSKGNSSSGPLGFSPWYELPNRLTQNVNVLFGHWSALLGKCSYPNVYALDSGCVWGNALTALRLEDTKRFEVNCN